MFIKVYNLVSDQVEGILREADETSAIHTGSHDDSHRRVGVNGVERPVRISKYSVTQRRSYESEVVNDPGDFPVIADVNTAWVLETRAHYGSSQRSRSHLRLFSRFGDGTTYIVFDLAEVGEESNYSPFKENTVVDTLLKARKRLRVEVDKNLYASMSQFIDHRKVSMITNPSEWITEAFYNAFGLIQSLRAACRNSCIFQEDASNAVKAVWLSTSLGMYLRELGLS